MAEILIVGAGLSGLSCGLLLNKYGFAVTLIEKQQFPAHKVCGEYVSNEVFPFLLSLDIDVTALNPSEITALELTTASGGRFAAPLQLGGFGLSRYQFDHLLYEKALENGIKVHAPAKVNAINFDGNKFSVTLSDNHILYCDLVIAAFGKRSNLDQKLNRRFFYDRSPYMGVKYHFKADLPPNVIQLHNFDGGYCGICKIEDDRYNLCYLTQNRHLKTHGSLEDMHQQILFKNRHLKQIFTTAEFVSAKPLVINEVSFERKTLVENHILFCGDAAGMIAPLCGNGMAMAIHSGKILAETIIEHLLNDPELNNRQGLETSYKQRWQKQFALRLNTGRAVQNLFLKPFLADLSVSTFNSFPHLARILEKRTRGRPF